MFYSWKVVFRQGPEKWWGELLGYLQENIPKEGLAKALWWVHIWSVRTAKEARRDWEEEYRRQHQRKREYNGQEWSKAMNELDPYILLEQCPCYIYRPILEGHIYMMFPHFIIKVNGRRRWRGWARRRGTSYIYIRSLCIYVFQSRIKYTPQT